MIPTNITHARSYPRAILKNTGYNPGSLRRPARSIGSGVFMRNLVRFTRLFVRCWLTLCYMRRLNYTRRLAWVKAER